MPSPADKWKRELPIDIQGFRFSKDKGTVYLSADKS